MEIGYYNNYSKWDLPHRSMEHKTVPGSWWWLGQNII